MAKSHLGFRETWRIYKNPIFHQSTELHVHGALYVGFRIEELHPFLHCVSLGAASANFSDRCIVAAPPFQCVTLASLLIRACRGVRPLVKLDWAPPCDCFGWTFVVYRSLFSSPPWRIFWIMQVENYHPYLVPVPLGGLQINGLLDFDRFSLLSQAVLHWSPGRHATGIICCNG